MAAKTKAQQIIDDNSVVVFSKSYCPYCKATKSLLDDKGAKYFVMELDQVGTCGFQAVARGTGVPDEGREHVE